jgi:hypothetical protein
MSSAVAACTLALLSGLPVAAAAEPEIGTTVVIEKTVTGTLGTVERKLEKGVRVHRNELLRTGQQAQAELKLDDNTKLALGPDAELLLDEYAVAGGTSAKSIALKFVKGTLRFLTGSNASENYKLETPSATIGVRGTVFDVYIGPGGDTFVLLHKGEVEVCSQTRMCRPHRTVGRVVPGVKVAQAFPFVGKRLVVDPVSRLTHTTITETGKVLERGGTTIERTLKKLSPF